LHCLKDAIKVIPL